MDILAERVLQELWDKQDTAKAAFYPSFFKTGAGEYGEGDRFIGVDVPTQRQLAKKFRNLSTTEISKLLESVFHEARLTALLILVDRYQKAASAEEKSELSEFYLSQLDRVNNWDLVDASAYKILGAEMVRTGDLKALETLADSRHLWRERVAVMSTMALIRAKDFEPTLALCQRFLDHDHDLIHKATGWMLREIGKISKNTLELFLARHGKKMPRTMLRYAIEKLPKSERDMWLERSRV